MNAINIILAIVMFSGCATKASHTSLNEGKSLPELIPVRDFVANRGSNFGYRISPDGRKLAWLAVKGVSLHIFIKDLEHGTTRVLPAGNSFFGFDWAQDSRHLIFTNQLADENSACMTLDTEQADDNPRPVQITPEGDVKAVLVRQIANDPAHVLIVHNQRDRSIFDLYKIDINTKKQILIAKNPGNATGVLINPQGELKGRIVKQESAFTLELLQPDATYKPLYRWTSDDEVGIVSIADTGGKLYLLSNKNRDRTALIEIATASGEERVLYEDSAVDVTGVFAHPLSGKPLFAFTEPGYPKVAMLDPSLKTSFGFLKGKDPARFSIVSSDAQFRRMTLTLSTDKGSDWYLYDLEHDRLEKLGSSPSLEHKADLADLTPIEFVSRDGLPLHGYLTLPKGASPRQLPTVLRVHGGPWGRDAWGYDSEVQFLANRGYAVLLINYRGSTGYGRQFQKLAIGEFAGKMQDDLLDGVKWAIDKGIADPQKIAIAGGSYGGYATLVGMSFTPETFACGIDLFGPTDLVKLVEDFPPYWKFEMDRWYQYVGDPGKPADRLVMQAKSPLFKAENITKPLFVIQGGQDVRVKANQSIRLVEKLRQSNKQVDFWLIPGAGHGISHWPQRLSQFRRTEDFLSRCLGGRSSNFDYYQLGAWLF